MSAAKSERKLLKAPPRHPWKVDADSDRHVPGMVEMWGIVSTEASPVYVPPRQLFDNEEDAWRAKLDRGGVFNSEYFVVRSFMVTAAVLEK